MSFRRQGWAALAAAAIGCGLAGCGSASEAPGVVQAPQGGATAAAVTSTPTTPTTPSTTTPAVKTPTSGPLSKQPVMPKTSGKAPAKLVTKDLVTGTGPVAKPGSTVVVNYVGELYSNDKVFNNSFTAGQTFGPFKLGQGAVIPGWDKGIVGMRVGGRRELVIPSSLAYGKTGSGSTIPPNAALVFVVDLLSAKG